MKFLDQPASGIAADDPFDLGQGADGQAGQQHPHHGFAPDGGSDFPDLDHLQRTWGQLAARTPRAPCGASPATSCASYGPAVPAGPAVPPTSVRAREPAPRPRKPSGPRPARLAPPPPRSPSRPPAPRPPP